MSSKTLNSKCIKCSKGFLNTKWKTVWCTLSSNHLHLKCTDLNKNTYHNFSGDKDFICQYCSQYSGISCEKHVYDKKGGIFCDGCDLWTHRWRAGGSKLECKWLKNLLKHGTVKSTRKACSLFLFKWFRIG